MYFIEWDSIIFKRIETGSNLKWRSFAEPQTDCVSGRRLGRCGGTQTESWLEMKGILTETLWEVGGGWRRIFLIQSPKWMSKSGRNRFEMNLIIGEEWRLDSLRMNLLKLNTQNWSSDTFHRLLIEMKCANISETVAECCPSETHSQASNHQRIHWRFFWGFSKGRSYGHLVGARIDSISKLNSC